MSIWIKYKIIKNLRKVNQKEQYNFTDLNQILAILSKRELILD